MQCNNTPK